MPISLPKRGFENGSSNLDGVMVTIAFTVVPMGPKTKEFRVASNKYWAGYISIYVADYILLYWSSLLFVSFNKPAISANSESSVLFFDKINDDFVFQYKPKPTKSAFCK